ncbi:MAG: ECF transporter S component [candidate division Zixibacteria bacterium]|nr:ECF transporter S component [candidate division Zixibacteria bacterium]
MSRARLIARIALFAALVYVCSWMLAMIPNVKVTFFIIFTAGFVWGAPAGMLVGAVGTGLWSLFNPYGPVAIPILVAQVAGSALCGLVGTIFRSTGLYDGSTLFVRTALIICGLLCTLAYYLPVSAVDAWVFQPFRERLLAGIPWVGIALASNAIIFPLLFGVARLLYDRENARP